MDRESQMIQEQMRQTRASLAEKLETLETHVIDGARDAASAVNKTVETVTQTVQDAVTGTRETVQCTMAAARETMHETVDAVKGAFDLKHHVQEHPWIMLGTSAAAGFLAGRLIWEAEASLQSRRVPHTNGAHGQSMHPAFEAAEKPPQPAGQKSGTHGLVGELTIKFSSEIDKLKSLGIATALGFLRDMAKQCIPEHMAPQVAEVFDSVTTKLGGEPIEGPVLPGLAQAMQGNQRREGQAYAGHDSPAKRRW